MLSSGAKICGIKVSRGARLWNELWSIVFSDGHGREWVGAMEIGLSAEGRAADGRAWGRYKKQVVEQHGEMITLNPS